VQRDDDDAWRAIVDNYGDRAELEPEDEAPVRAPEPARPAYDDLDADDRDDADIWRDPDESYVPPPAPPIPRPPTDRLLAWVGVLGAPVVMLLLVALQISLPEWGGLLLAGAFVGGFLYLVFRTPRSPRDPWDDGARV
jgi:hypothetical protein